MMYDVKTKSWEEQIAFAQGHTAGKLISQVSQAWNPIWSTPETEHLTSVFHVF